MEKIFKTFPKITLSEYFASYGENIISILICWISPIVFVWLAIIAVISFIKKKRRNKFRDILNFSAVMGLLIGMPVLLYMKGIEEVEGINNDKRDLYSFSMKIDKVNHWYELKQVELDSHYTQQKITILNYKLIKREKYNPKLEIIENGTGKKYPYLVSFREPKDKDTLHFNIYVEIADDPAARHPYILFKDTNEFGRQYNVGPKLKYGTLYVPSL